MIFYEERLAIFIFFFIFILWLYVLLTSQLKNLVTIEFKHILIKSNFDNVEYIECKLKLSGWKSHDNVFIKHVSRSPKCSSPYSSLI